MAAHLLLVAAILIAALPTSTRPASAQTFHDEYRTGGLPDLSGRQVRILQTVGGGPCEDTARYDRFYGTRPVRVPIPQMGQFEPDVISGIIFYARCAVDVCAVDETMLCWPRRDVFSTRSDFFEPGQPTRIITFPLPEDRYATGGPSGPPDCDNPSTYPADASARYEWYQRACTRRQQAQTHVPTIPPREAGRGPGDCFDQAAPAVLTALADVRRRLQIAQTKADRLGDPFVAESVRVLTGYASWLAQPHGKPSEDVWRGITSAPQNVWGAVTAYLTNDNAANHRALRDGTKRAIEGIQQNPSGALGWLAGTIAVGGYTGAGPGFGRCPAGANTARIASAAANAEKAARRIAAVAEAGDALEGVEFTCGASAFQRPLDAIRFHAQRRRTNPKLRDHACVGTTIADHLQKEGFPVTLEDILPPGWRTNGFDPPELRRLFARIADGGPSPKGMSGDDLLHRDAGNTRPHAGLGGVDDELLKAGDGARVAVAVRLRPEFHQGKIVGHVFTGERLAGVGNVYYDAETMFDAAHWFEKATSINTFRLK